MSWFLSGLEPEAQPGPGPVPGPPPPPPSSKRKLSNPFIADTEEKGSKYRYVHDPEEDQEGEDYEEKEEYYKRYRLNEMTAKQQIIIGGYQIMDPAPLLKGDGTNMGSIPITFTSGFSFNLKTTETIKHFFIKIDGTYYAFEFRYGKRKSYEMDQEDNTSNYNEFDGAFKQSAIQYEIDTKEPIKHLGVNVYKTDKYGRVISEHNHKKLQLQKNLIENARKKVPAMSGVDVNISETFIYTLLDKNPNGSVEPAPELYEEKVDRRIENTRNALGIYTDATRSGLDLLERLKAYRDFYNALFVTTNPNPANDKRKFENMSDIELKNYIEKLYHIVDISQLDDTKKNEIKEYLRILYKSPDRTTILDLKSVLTGLLRDTKTIDLMGINNEVPIIDEGYFNDKDWMKHYHAGMAAAYVLNKRAFPLTIGLKLGAELDNIKRVIDDPTVVSDEKLKRINESLQTIKGIFLPKLMVLLNGIQSLVENHPLTREYVIVDLDNITTLEQALDRLTQFLASSKLIKNQELQALELASDFDGGSRLKQKKRTRKRTKKQNKKRNKSKRHKGYSRR
jgi:hypothetical protein